MAAKKKARSAASKKKASAKKKSATRSATAARKPIPKSADAPSHVDPVRAFARSFALRHQR